MDYEKLIQHIEDLHSVGINATGRTGSDYLHSLLENHDEILTFPAHFLIYSQFFRESITMKVENNRACDVADEIIGYYIYKFVSLYDYQEGRDRLGPDLNQFNEIDTAEFKRHFVGLIGRRALSKKNILLAIYGAYNICNKKDILKTKVLLFHPHLEYETKLFLEDFNSTRLIFTTRDPRANFYSIIKNFRDYSPDNDTEEHFYNSLRMILRDARLGQELNIDFLVVKLEDLPRINVIKDLCNWLGIKYSSNLLRSTWGGLDWHGDRLSKKLYLPVGWSKDRTSNNWEKNLNFIDKLRLSVLMRKRMHYYGYCMVKPTYFHILLVFATLWLPFSYELKYLNLRYYFSIFLIEKKSKKLPIVSAPYFYIKRIFLCYGFLWRSNEKISWAYITTSNKSNRIGTNE
ncbi:sulfotransferase [Polynucleobacter sp. es-GGE-1]|uniref:sulfotransferase n=1 Tax=Polynucleobacter sp. es-GGE-1 TaxID=1819724 RepID=UPI001C0B61C8|nr:sulfotransferase [Polynucleobacter sp. es-GGE-1]MBU3635545.1 sulfotransferase [Polynucleobacter sp. es-GGE-1]